MASYRVAAYRPARRYRRSRYPYRYRSRKNSGGVLPAVIAGAVLLAGAGAGAKAVTSHHAHRPAPAPATGNRVAAEVVAFARSKVGKVPYLWGGTTDAGMDCSGLAQSAYAAAGISIERTSQQQWASERHVTSPVPGDLVFFAGSDGTATAPGHVGIVTGKNTMIDAYATGTDVRYDTFGAAAAPGTGLGAVVGFTDPAPAPVPSAPRAGGSETAFITSVLGGISAPPTAANTDSVAAWIRHEWPSWPPKAQENPLDTTLAMPGSWNFNTFGGGLHVQSYPSAAEGVRATAATLLGGYPLIVSALRSGAGLCGNSALAGEFGKWSGNGYAEVC
jgi:cell wall-associated NlpC family hydrolase